MGIIFTPYDLVVLNSEFIVIRQTCPRKSFFFAILRTIILEIPAFIILNYAYPLYGLAYAQTVTEIILATAAVIVLGRMFQALIPLSARPEKSVEN